MKPLPLAERGAIRRIALSQEGPVLLHVLRGIVDEPTFIPENDRLTSYRLGRQSLARDLLRLLEKDMPDA
jgi:hypothetical protein